MPQGLQPRKTSHTILYILRACMTAGWAIFFVYVVLVVWRSLSQGSQGHAGVATWYGLLNALLYPFALLAPGAPVWLGSVLIGVFLVLLLGLTMATLASRPRTSLPHDTNSSPGTDGAATANSSKANASGVMLDATRFSTPVLTDDGTKLSDQSEKPHAFVPRIFISHSSADDDFGHQLTAELQAVFGEDAVWYDSAGGLKGGDRWWRRIRWEIDKRNVIVLILSPEAIGSEWVQDEIDLAWTQRKVIIPLLHHPCDVPTDLAMIQHISFLPQRPFGEALEELVSAIKLGESRRIPGMPMRPIGAKRIKPSGVPKTPLLIGRDSEAAQIEQAVRRGETSGVCALNGMGGIGKTALAARVAQRLYEDQEAFPGGVAWIDCKGKSGDDGLSDLWSSVARALSLDDVALQQNPAIRLELLVRSLGERPRTLLVLDNLEPNVNVRSIVDHLAIPGSSALLLTARRRIDAELDQQIILHPLSQKDGETLFSDRMELTCRVLSSSSMRPSADDRKYIGSLTESLGGLPLALHLTASYAVRQSLTLFEVLKEVRAGRLDANPLQDSQDGLRGCFQRSWRVLPWEQQVLFAGLSLLTGATIPEEGALQLAKLVTAMSPVRPEENQETGSSNATESPSGNVSIAPEQRERLDRDIAQHSFALFSMLNTEDRTAAARLPEFRSRVTGSEANFARIDLPGDLRGEERGWRALHAIIDASLLEGLDRVRSRRLYMHPFLQDYAREQLLTFPESVQEHLGKIVLEYWLEFVRNNSYAFGSLALQAEQDGLVGILGWAWEHNMIDAARAIGHVLTQVRDGKLRPQQSVNLYVRLKTRATAAEEQMRARGVIEDFVQVGNPSQSPRLERLPRRFWWRLPRRFRRNHSSSRHVTLQQNAESWVRQPVSGLG